MIRSWAIDYIFRWAIIMNFHRATNVYSSYPNESYWQNHEKTKDNGEHEKRDNINTWVSCVHSLML